ncbi:MAG: hypothetical protein LIO67_05210 [Lachnospiraceae bacterium]|nr:hypothetical protein [Lachnospiraceae bacterium]
MAARPGRKKQETEAAATEQPKKSRKERKAEKQREQDDSGRRMRARVISIRDGVEDFESVRIVHVDSSRYNLMLMPDYTPSIGEVEGTVRIVTDERVETYERVKGFFMLRDNEFQLLVKEEYAVSAEAAQEPEGGELEFIDLEGQT